MSVLPTYRSLIAATDFSPLSHAALHTASDLSRLLGAEILRLVHVRTRVELYGVPRYPIGLPPAIVAQVEAEAIEQAKAHLDGIELTATQARVLRQVRIGGAVEELVAVAKETQADLLVLATHGRSAIGRFFLGSVASGVIRAAPCPVFVAGRDRQAVGKLRRILAAVDLSDVSPTVLRHAAAFAERSGAALEVLSVYELPLTLGGDALVPLADAPMLLVEPEEHQREVEDLVRRTELPASIAPAIRLDQGHPATVILDHARREGADLIVIGTSGHNALLRMTLGSTATRVVAQADCPVLVIPND